MILESISLKWLILIGLVLIYIVSWLRTEYKIRRLGGHAPKVWHWLPLGVDTVVEAIQHAARNENLAFWNKNFLKYGHRENPYTVEVNGGGRRVLFTADPENIKAVLATQFQDFGKGEEFRKEWHAFLGDSIFTTDHRAWSESRLLIRPQFIKDRVSDLEVFEHHISILMPLLRGKGQEVDVKDLFFRYTLDAATQFLLGRSVGSLENGEIEFAEAFGEVQRIQNLISRAGPLNIFISRKKFNEHIKVIDKFVEPYIDETLALSQDELEKRSKSDQGYTFLHALASYTRDRKVLRDQLIAVLLAGRDTTACTLSWLFYEISKNEEIVKKLRQEIADTVGWERPPTYAHLKNMHYLQHTMNETLRLYPVVPFNVREALRDTTLPHGGGPTGLSPVGVPKGTPVGYSTQYLHLSEEVYPQTSSTFPDPLLFVPERWDKWQPRPWTYIPFNGGPRICIGQQFALTEMAYTVVRILQKFSRVESRIPKRSPQGAKTESGQFNEKFNRTQEGNHDSERLTHTLEDRMSRSLAGRATRNRDLKMKSEIVLQPADKVLVAFYEA